MRSTAATDSKPHPRSRKTPIAALLALLALGAGAQALAPAGAAAVANEQTSGECYEIGSSGVGQRANGEFCAVVQNSGGSGGDSGSSMSGWEVISTSGKAPKEPTLCLNPRNCLPGRVGADDGRSQGGETPRPDPKGRGLGLKPEPSGAKKPPKKPQSDAAKKRECQALWEDAFDGQLESAQRTRAYNQQQLDAALEKQGSGTATEDDLEAIDWHRSRVEEASRKIGELKAQQAAYTQKKCADILSKAPQAGSDRKKPESDQRLSEEEWLRIFSGDEISPFCSPEYRKPDCIPRPPSEF